MARHFAFRSGSLETNTEHLLIGLIDVHATADLILERHGIDVTVIRQEMEQYIRSEASYATQPREIPDSASLTWALRFAADEAERSRDKFLATHNLLIGIVAEPNGFVSRHIVGTYGVDYTMLRATIYGFGEMVGADN